MQIIVQEWLGKFLVSIGGAKEATSEKPKEEPKPMPTVPPAPVEPRNNGTTKSPDMAYLWQTVKNDPEDEAYITNAVAGLRKNRLRYEVIAKQTGVPWQVIAVIHKMESNCDFSTHMHNGDSLSARTVNVPAGRPVNGKPPFSFEESAVDALGYDGATGINDWNIVATLQFLERYNGLGYRNKGIYSPYLWAGTCHYKKGKYTSDGVYNSEVVSDQLGCVPMLKGLGYDV